jgi:hypothetical protein
LLPDLRALAEVVGGTVVLKELCWLENPEDPQVSKEKY